MASWEMIVQRRSTDELVELARCGGSITVYADTRPVDELIEIAAALQSGATLTLLGMAMRPNQDLCKIAEAAPGRVTFA